MGGRWEGGPAHPSSSRQPSQTTHTHTHTLPILLLWLQPGSCPPVPLHLPCTQHPQAWTPCVRLTAVSARHRCSNQHRHDHQPDAPKVRRERLEFLLFWRIHATHVPCLFLSAQLYICEHRLCVPGSLSLQACVCTPCPHPETLCGPGHHQPFCPQCALPGTIHCLSQRVQKNICHPGFPHLPCP